MTHDGKNNGRLMVKLETITRAWRDGELSDVAAVGQVLSAVNYSPLPSPIEIDMERQPSPRQSFSEFLDDMADLLGRDERKCAVCDTSMEKKVSSLTGRVMWIYNCTCFMPGGVAEL